MYASHFGLRGEPFSLTPDPAFLYLSPDHDEALAALKVGLETRRGLMLMVAEVGMGKTTLLYSMLSELGPNIHTAYLSNTRLTFDELLRQALSDLGATCASRDRIEMLAALNAFLLQCADAGETAALVIDEAQNLDDDTFEHLRLLSNYETYTDKLLQIVLVGQPELEAKLARPSIRQVTERIAVRCHINPLSRSESLRYLEHRLQKAGGSTALFSPLALELLLWKARGIPRRLNILCHSALLFAYGRGATQVSLREAHAAVREKQGRGLVTIGPRLGLSAPGIAPLNEARLWRIAAAGAAAGLVFALGWGSGYVGARSDVESTRAALPAAASPLEAPPAAPAGPIAKREEPKATAPAAPAVVAAPAVQAPPAAPAVAAPPPAAAPVARAAELIAAAPRIDDVPAVPPADAIGAPADGTPPDDVATERGYREIVVPRGTSLNALALHYYGTTRPSLVERIKALNPQIRHEDRILAGDTLRLPEPDADATTPSRRR